MTMKLLTIAVFTILFWTCVEGVKAQSTGKLKKVVIDAGHGGKDRERMVSIRKKKILYWPLR
ncbi:hypothetical protein JCM21142_3826 [Saccharicrinis fermentans DSM 9555 = JCM 21142]|uniref:Uncharacterized protein n=2 Tax=Saccharicrinis fermentans TaxID=982 RepID=W7Y3P2_9BACT|nr:hypothetical protein JCM21142_3826 [Saccharicrinis fermentans DSM 9555 = JCM 21142]